MGPAFLSRGLPFGLAVGLIPIGLATRGVPGWVNDHGGGIVYVLFWCFAARAVWPGASALRIVAVVLGGTCAVEVLQLWHPPWLESIRSSLLGSVLLGRAFDFLDIAHYVAAATIGYLSLRWLESAREV